jgi:hypothetical protein
MIVVKTFFKKMYKDLGRLWSYENTFTKDGVFNITDRALSIPLEYDKLENARDGWLNACNGNRYFLLKFQKTLIFASRLKARNRSLFYFLK